MHRSVLKNDDYMKFADENTVEVISVSGVAKANESGDERADTFEAEVDGKKVELLYEWPNLTIDEIEALRSSKAGSYNTTGGIPFTCLVDPHTLEILTNGDDEPIQWSGSQTAKTLIEAVTEAREALVDEHGKGFKRKDLRKIDDAREDAMKAVGKRDFAKALKSADKIAKKAKDWPEDVVSRITKIREDVIALATEAIDEIEGMDDTKEARKLLGRFRNKLKGTGLSERAKALYDSLK